jgi:hypothetical protein
MVAVKQSHIEQQSSIELYLKSWGISMCATVFPCEQCSNQCAIKQCAIKQRAIKECAIKECAIKKCAIKECAIEQLHIELFRKSRATESRIIIESFATERHTMP